MCYCPKSGQNRLVRQATFWHILINYEQYIITKRALTIVSCYHFVTIIPHLYIYTWLNIHLSLAKLTFFLNISNKMKEKRKNVVFLSILTHRELWITKIRSEAPSLSLIFLCLFVGGYRDNARNNCMTQLLRERFLFSSHLRETTI